MGASYETICDTYDKKEWLALRREYVGASDNLTDSNAQIKAGLKPEFTGSRHSYFGDLLEYPAIQAFRQWAGMDAESLGRTDKGSRYLMFRSKSHPHMAATLDGYCSVPLILKQREKLQRFLEKDMGFTQECIDDIMSDYRNAILEVKTPGWWLRKEWGELTTPEDKDDYPRWLRGFRDVKKVPKKYYTQVQHQMSVMGAEVAWLLALCGGKRLIAYRIERDQEAIDKRVSDCYDFIHKVKEYVCQLNDC